MKLTTLFLALVPAMALAQSSIPVSVDAEQAYTNTQGRRLNSVSVSTPSNGVQTLTAVPGRVYSDLTDRRIYVKPGETVSVTFGYSTDWMNGYVYIDADRDGQLTTTLAADGTPAAGSELCTYSFYSGNDEDDTAGRNSRGEELTGGKRNVLNPPSFTLPADLPEGEYVVRFKVDWNSLDPAGDTNTANGTFMSNGGAIVDATLLVTQESVPKVPRMHFVSNYGFFVGNGGETGLPDAVPSTDLQVKLVAPGSCYTRPSEISVWTVDADGVASEPTTLQRVATGLFTIPAELMQGGDVWVKAEFGEPDSYKATDYRLAFSDEFDGADHSQPNSEQWKRADHNNNSAWNRFVSTSDKVVYVEDGDLVTRCIPCAEEDWESNKNPISPYNYREWMSGAVDTRTKYSFQYGRVDVRSKTNPFTGSFPAIWLLPDDQSAGWPQYGEIDIWEMVNTSNAAHGTIHAQRESQYTKNTPCNYDGLYHVFTFEWTATQMKWSVDGTVYSTHNKSSYSDSQIASGFWPFDKKYYLILNQSVGAGGWAANPVAGHEYETRFDFVRIYQTEKQNPTVGISAPAQSERCSVMTDAPAYDLQGRAVRALTSASLSHGLYVQNGKKVIR